MTPPSEACLIIQQLYILDPLSPGIIRSICIIAISWALLLRVLIALTKLNWFGLGSGGVGIRVLATRDVVMSHVVSLI